MSTVEEAPAAANRASGPRTTVLDFTRDLMRRRGMTTVFGNPGSTELAFLADFPDDFRYVLGLQEAVVVGMADGYAQATGRPTLVNLHTAPGVGNAMGGIFNAQANKSPLVITAGQQARELITLQANLTNRDAARMPHPLVKWSYEPPRAQDVPLALARAAHVATLPPAGPVFVSIPMDDWGVEADAGAVEHAIARTVTGRATADPEVLRELAERLAGARHPVSGAGPDVARADGRRHRGRRAAHARGARCRPAGRGPRAAPGPPGPRRRAGERPDERLGGDGGAGRRVAGGRHRGRRGAERHARAAQPAAPLAPGQLLLRRRRWPWLRPCGGGRRAARPARAPRRVRPGRGLGPIRDPGVLERGGLRGAADRARGAQRRVRDPQVVLVAGGGRRRARPRPARTRRAERGRGLRGALAPGGERRRTAQRAGRRNRLRCSRGGGGPGRARDVARLDVMALLAHDPRRIADP